MAQVATEPDKYEIFADIVIIGAGACGLVAALAAREEANADASILLLERDSKPSGSTSLSSGFIPAAGTLLQKERGISDNPELFAADVQAKAKGLSHKPLLNVAVREIGPTIEWLMTTHRLPFVLIDGFLYPGHSVLRMHAMPEKTGSALHAALLEAAQSRDITIACNQKVEILYKNNQENITGVGIRTQTGALQMIGCAVVILACNGFGGNSDLVTEYIPEMANSHYFGHAGNQGEAVLWGKKLGAKLADMSGYQGHGSIAWPQGALISWAIMMEGGVLINTKGLRFTNEHEGYSEQAARVMAQPDQTAYALFDQRLLVFGQGFPDFLEAEKAGAVISANNLVNLAKRLKISVSSLQQTLGEIAACQRGVKHDKHGRDFTKKPNLTPPYHAVKVKGALFHTQGGVNIDKNARVLNKSGQALPNLFAAGGAARGVSGPDVSGYLSGNGLLTAVALGRVAGRNAARMILERDHIV